MITNQYDKQVIELDVKGHIEELKANDMKVIEMICDQLDSKLEHLFIPCRKKEVANSRHLVCLYLKTEKNYTLKKIGGIVGVKPKDHTTVLNSIEVANKLIKKKPFYRNVYSLILQAKYGSFTALKYRPCTN